MTKFVYELDANQDDPAPARTRFEVGAFLRGLPDPTTQRGDHEGRSADPAFKWVLIPSVFAWYNSLHSLRRRYPSYQFDKADSSGALVASGKLAGQPGFRIRVRHDPHR